MSKEYDEDRFQMVVGAAITPASAAAASTPTKAEFDALVTSSTPCWSSPVTPASSLSTDRKTDS